MDTDTPLSPKLKFLLLLQGRLQTRDTVDKELGPSSRGEVEEPTIQRTSTGKLGGLFGRSDYDADTIRDDLRFIVRTLKAIDFVGSKTFEADRKTLGVLLKKWAGRDVASEEREAMQSELAEGRNLAADLAGRIEDERKEAQEVHEGAEEERSGVGKETLLVLQEAREGADESDTGALIEMKKAFEGAKRNSETLLQWAENAKKLARGVIERTRDRKDQEFDELAKKALVRFEKATKDDAYCEAPDDDKALTTLQAFNGLPSGDQDGGKARGVALHALEDKVEEIESRNQKNRSVARKVRTLLEKLAPSLELVDIHGEPDDRLPTKQALTLVNERQDVRDYAGALDALQKLAEALDARAERAERGWLGKLAARFDVLALAASELEEAPRLQFLERSRMEQKLTDAKKALRKGSPELVVETLEALREAVGDARRSVVADEQAEEALSRLLEIVQAEYEDIAYDESIDVKLRKPLHVKRDGLDEKMKPGHWGAALKHCKELRSQVRGAAEKGALLNEERTLRLEKQHQEWLRIEAEMNRAEEQDERVRAWGEKEFTTPLMAAIWRATWNARKKGDQNCSIAGPARGYDAVSDAITEWWRASSSAPLPLEGMHVPSGGIQEKWTHKIPRNEVQANFICTYRGNGINVHVDVDVQEFLARDKVYAREAVPEVFKKLLPEL